MTALSEAADRLARVAIGALKRRQKDRLALKHQKKIAAFFQRQKGQILAELKERGYLFTESYRQLSEETPQLTLQNWDRIWERIARDDTPDLQRTVAAAQVDGLVAGADQLRKQINPGGKFWDLANPRAVRWFRDNGGSVDKISGIQRTTGDSLKRLIGTSLDEGWSYTATAKEIQKLYDGPISRDRAQRIAVFETGKAYEKGNELFARSLEDDGVGMEEHWMSSHDAKVRPEHDNVTGNESEGWVPMGHTFSSGHTEPPTDPGCRCYMIYRAQRKES